MQMLCHEGCSGGWCGHGGVCHTSEQSNSSFQMFLYQDLLFICIASCGCSTTAEYTPGFLQNTSLLIWGKCAGSCPTVQQTEAMLVSTSITMLTFFLG